MATAKAFIGRANTATGWSNINNCVGSNESTYATGTGTRNQNRPITVGQFNFSALPDNIAISRISVRVRSRVSNASRGTWAGTCSFGALTLTATTSLHNDTTVFSGSWTKSDVQNITATLTNYRTSSSSYSTYLALIEITLTYETTEDGHQIYVGPNEIGAVHVGNNEIDAIYVGDDKIL